MRHTQKLSGSHPGGLHVPDDYSTDYSCLRRWLPVDFLHEKPAAVVLRVFHVIAFQWRAVCLSWQRLSHGKSIQQLALRGAPLQI
jgi:hypothetical protein